MKYYYEDTFLRESEVPDYKWAVIGGRLFLTHKYEYAQNELRKQKQEASSNYDAKLYKSLKIVKIYLK